MADEPKQDLRKLRKTKIELAGSQVMEHLIELVKNTDLSYYGMAKRINEVYGLEVTKSDIFRFFQKNCSIIEELKLEQTVLKKIRSDLVLEHVSILIKDIRKLDGELDKLSGEDGKLMEPDKRAHAIANLIDKKGKLLLREARLSGKVTDEKSTSIDKMQVNVFNQVNEEKSEIIRKLKTFEPTQVIDTESRDVTPDENKKTNT